VVLALAALAAAAAPALAPHSVWEQFADYPNAPPMRIRIVDDAGRWQRPFVYPIALADRLERSYAEDRSRRLPVQWFRGGALVDVGEAEGPLFLLGSDSLGRDVLARLLHGARVSLGVAAVGAIGALLIGALIGGIAGYAGGRADEALMRLADFVLVLPAVYVILALRAVLPLVIEPLQLFVLVSSLLAAVGWPYAARGVRAIVAAERDREYALAARSLGAGHVRLLLRHLLPASKGFLAVQATLLLPAFILAEATLSFVGFGFADPVPSWGTMLRDLTSGNIADVTRFPWLLTPALAIILVVLAVHLAVGTRGEATVLAGLSEDR
jgi:peptide/nickel transport system permease protein